MRSVCGEYLVKIKLGLTNTNTSCIMRTFMSLKSSWTLWTKKVKYNANINQYNAQGEIYVV